MLRPLERSQVVWHLAVELAGSTGAEERFIVARELLRAAGNDPTTLSHALALGGAQLRHPSGDAAVQRGVDVLAWTVKFLGHRRGSSTTAPAEDAVTARRRGPARD